MFAKDRLWKTAKNNTSHIFYLDVQSVPGTEEKSEEPGLTREELKEQERLRWRSYTEGDAPDGHRCHCQEGGHHDRRQGEEDEVQEAGGAEGVRQAEPQGQGGLF